VPMTRATALAMKLALITGQRIGEVAGIAENELATDGALPMWVIPRGRTKNSEPNRVPLSPIALRIITEARELAAGSPWLFPGPTGEAMQTHSATRALERSRKAIGIEHFRVHDLRRTAATGMAEQGISPHTIGLVLNHITVRRGSVTSGVYIHYAYDKEKREALEVWGRRLEELLGSHEIVVDNQTLYG
jgi:integrase